MPSEISSHLAGPLSRKVEQATALAMHRGWNITDIADMLGRRFGIEDEGHRNQLIAFSQSVRDAGHRLNDLGSDARLSVTDFPLNQYLYGDDPGGRRGRLGIDIQPVPGGNYFTVYIDLADITSLADLLELINEAGRDRLDYVRGGANLPAENFREVEDFFIHLAERRF